MSNTVFALFDIAIYLLSILSWIVIAQVILSWLIAFNVINLQSGFVRSLVDLIDRITRPLYRPIRRIMPDMGGLDLSPFVLLVTIYILQRVLVGVAGDVSMAFV